MPPPPVISTCFEGAGWRLLFLPCLLWGCLPTYADFLLMLSFLTTQGVLTIYENIKCCVTFMTFLLIIWTKRAILHWFRTQCLEREFFVRLIYLIGTAVIAVSIVPYLWFPLYEFYDCISERIMPAWICRLLKKFRDIFFLIVSLLAAIHCLSQTDLFRRPKPIKPPNPNAPMLSRSTLKTLALIKRIFLKIFRFIYRALEGFYKVTMRTIRDCPIVGKMGPTPRAGMPGCVGYPPFLGDSVTSLESTKSGFFTNVWGKWMNMAGLTEDKTLLKKGVFTTKNPGEMDLSEDVAGGAGDLNPDGVSPAPAQPSERPAKRTGRGRPKRNAQSAGGAALAQYRHGQPRNQRAASRVSSRQSEASLRRVPSYLYSLTDARRQSRSRGPPAGSPHRRVARRTPAIRSQSRRRGRNYY